MEAISEARKISYMKLLFAILWIFLSVNYIYCDQLSTLEPGVLEETMTGFVADGTVQITPVFLLGTAIMMEIPFLMIVLSWVLRFKINRWVNIIAAAVMVLIQISSLFLGVPSLMYIFYSVVEIGALLTIIVLAWRWSGD